MINNILFNLQLNIDNLFDKKLYTKIILKKYTTKLPANLIFMRIDNQESKFIINFINNNRIEITIPIKYKNYLYTTNFYIDKEGEYKIYEYLKYHISLH